MFNGVVIAPCRRLGSSGSRNSNPINETNNLPLTDVVSISKEKFQDLVGKKNDAGAKHVADLGRMTDMNKHFMEKDTIRQQLDKKLARYNGVADPFTLPEPLFNEGPIVP